MKGIEMRIGIVEISDTLYDENREMIQPVFDIMRDKKLFRCINRRTVFLRGECDQFEDVPEGGGIPFYECHLGKEEGQPLKIAFKLVENQAEIVLVEVAGEVIDED